MVVSSYTVELSVETDAISVGDCEVENHCSFHYSSGVVTISGELGPNARPSTFWELGGFEVYPVAPGSIRLKSVDLRDASRRTINVDALPGAAMLSATGPTITPVYGYIDDPVTSGFTGTKTPAALPQTGGAPDSQYNGAALPAFALGLLLLAGLRAAIEVKGRRSH
jgi:hypothetical protein